MKAAFAMAIAAVAAGLVIAAACGSTPTLTVGATFQVSDNTIGSTPLRNLVTAHGLSAYVYNTAILAVGINLLAGAVGG